MDVGNQGGAIDCYALVAARTGFLSKELVDSDPGAAGASCLSVPSSVPYLAGRLPALGGLCGVLPLCLFSLAACRLGEASAFIPAQILKLRSCYSQQGGGAATPVTPERGAQQQQ